MTTLKTLSIKYKDLLALTQDYKEWMQFQVSLLGQLAIKRERREADFLLLIARQRYENFLTEYKNLSKAIPNYLRLTP